MMNLTSPYNLKKTIDYKGFFVLVRLGNPYGSGQNMNSVLAKLKNMTQTKSSWHVHLFVFDRARMSL